MANFCYPQSSIIDPLNRGGAATPPYLKARRFPGDSEFDKVDDKVGDPPSLGSYGAASKVGGLGSRQLLRAFAAVDEEEHGHADGEAVGDLFEDDGAAAVCDDD